MKNIIIVGIAALAAGLLVGCANETQGETSVASYVESSSSAESTTSSVESSSVQSSSSSTTSSSSSSAESSSSSSTSSEISSSSSVESSEESSSSSSAESKPQSSSSTTPASSSSSSISPTNSKYTYNPKTMFYYYTPHEEAVPGPNNTLYSPTGHRSEGEWGYTTEPGYYDDNCVFHVGYTLDFSTGLYSYLHTTDRWNPKAEGNTPGPYGGYYDASGKLHAIKTNIPKDSYGYPVVSYEDEYGDGHLTKAEKEKAQEDERRIAEGNYHPNIGLDWDDLP